MSELEILIVEDEDIVAISLQRKLARLGYQQLARVSSGEAALELAAQSMPRLALMDMGLGGNLDGIQTAQELRRRFNIPSVYLTANAELETLKRAKLTHPLGYLIKPFRDDELFRTVELALQNAELETKLRDSQRAFEELSRVLESRVIERTRELQNAKEAIQISLSEKEVLLKEVHHRVKNNLQIISSLLRMQVQASADSKAVDILRQSQARVRSMALIHECLYLSKNLSHVRFRDYIEKLARYLYSVYGVGTDVIAFRCEVVNDLMDLDTAIPCGLIVTEVLSNALKHAFPGGAKGEIVIQFKAEPGLPRTLTISDNGIGFTYDPAVPPQGTLGFKIIDVLSKQMNGHFTFQGGAGRGTVFTLELRDGAAAKPVVERRVSGNRT